MGRKRGHEEHENHERWLVSYADFITLLFAFFVVMYAVSSVNEGKYRVLSDSMITAFGTPARSLEPVQVGQPARFPYVDDISPVTMPAAIDLSGLGAGNAATSGEAPQADPADSQSADAPMADLDTVAEELASSLAELVEEDLIEVRRQDKWVEVEINTSILYPSGSARLVEPAIPILEKLAGILKGFPNPIHVEGFTDDVPISTTVFPSNWELSAARAASVVHVYMNYGVRPERMVAIGYGEHRPVADNDTPEGRSRNRRVVIVIPAGPQTRSHLELGRSSHGAGARGGGAPAKAPGGESSS